MLLTLPLVPVFMWLIGRYTEQRTRERWQALRAAVDPLPRRRAGAAHAAGVRPRGRPRPSAIGEVSERYRRDDDGDAAGQLPVGVGARARGDARGGAGRGRPPASGWSSGSLGLQAGLTVLMLAPELYLPFRRLGAEYHASADGLAVAERMFALLDAPAAAAAGGSRLGAQPRASASVRLERVSFSYPARPGPVLDGLDLELSPGETVALVGESGAGKSTVAALLLGLLSPTGGPDRRRRRRPAACRLDAWRRLVAWVPQHPTLFRGTVADNIRLGDPDASDRSGPSRPRALAGADEFIAALPDGYATLVGDGGRSLSPGERRRIGLARAFLRDAPLVILDEPTADLDPRSVAIVVDARCGACRPGGRCC